MKKTLYLPIAAVLGSAAFVLHRSYEAGDATTTALERIDPNEQLLLQRSYPDAQFDLAAYARGIAVAMEMRRESQASRSMEWVVEGPGNIGGRFNCIVAHPTNPSIIYAGAATGGVFKTTDGGGNWSPIFDEQPYLSIGCIALDPSNPNTVWVGTGDANISGFCYTGDGVYKSTDAGATWTHMGLAEQFVISTIDFNPSEPGTIYVGAMGNPFIRDDNRGLYRSTNGGASWEQVLFVSDQAGVIDLVIDPTNPDVLYASTFDRIRSNAERIAHGPGTRIRKSIDGGDTWSTLTNGLPDFPVSRIGLAISPSNPNIVYASIADSTYALLGVFKTTDAGANWFQLNTDGLNNYSNFGWYFGKIHVNPANPEQVYVLGVDSYTTTDGGLSWNLVAPEWWLYEVHADHHGMHFIDAQTILLCTDGGLYRTTDNCATWTDIDNIAVNQVYHAIENPYIAQDYWCGVQDNGTSNGNEASINAWARIFGGDGFLPSIDPVDQSVVYALAQRGALYYSTNGGTDFSEAMWSMEAGERFNWDMPYFISPHDHTVLYCGTHRVHRMTDAPFGAWEPISDDLTDGLGEGPNDQHTLTAVAQSPVNEQVLYAGSADANVWRTTNGGGNWTNVTGTLPVRYVTAVTPSPSEANTVYVTHSGYRDGLYIPHVHRSTNNGTSWTDITGDLPPVGVNDVLISPFMEELLFVSTDVGVYYSTNGGVNWQRLGGNMPLMPVFNIEFTTDGTKLIASTFARSVQTIDLTELLTVGVHGTVLTADDLLIHPSPAISDVSVRWSGRTSVDYAVYSNAGAQVATGRAAGPVFRIAVDQLGAGTYLLDLRAGEERVVRRFVKQ